MKRIGWLLLALALSVPALSGCERPAPVYSQGTGFEGLARWVPGDMNSVTFMDLKPAGDMGRHWERIRQLLASTPAGQDGLNAVYDQFRVKQYGLDPFLVGPAVNWYDGRVEYVIAQVGGDADPERSLAVQEAMLQHFADVAWQQEEYDGRPLYHGRTGRGAQQEGLAWAVRDGLLYLVYDQGLAPVAQLRTLLSLAQGESLAALPAWQTLRGRLPDTSLMLLFNNLAEQNRRSTPLPADASFGETLNRQFEAAAAAAIPEEQGMRVQIAGTVALQPDVPPEVRAVFDSPAVDPTTWTHVPTEAAITVIGYDASVLWPLLKEGLVSPEVLAQVREAVGLDLEADLASVGGSLAGGYAWAVLPPLPDQPVGQGLLAAQLLIVGRGATQTQAALVQAAMESRGAIFGPGEVEGVAVHTQVGTELSGYAITYGFDDGTLLFGSSPDAVGQAVVAWHAQRGLNLTENFQALQAALPADSSLIIYLNGEPLTRLYQANTTEEAYETNIEYALLEAFESVGAGLRFTPQRMDGVMLFFAPE